MKFAAIETLSTGTLKRILESLADKRAINGYLDSEDSNRLYTYERELRRRKKQEKKRRYRI